MTPPNGLVVPAARPRLPLGAQSIPEAIATATAPLADAEALVGRHSRLTYAELDDRVRRAAALLAAVGVGPGDRVAGSMGNHPDLVVAFLATMHLGAVWVGINRPLTMPEKHYLLDDAGVSVFVGDRDTAAEVDAHRKELPALGVVLDAEPADPASEWAERLAASDPGAAPAPAVDPFGPAAIAYTSGTTGRPKGVVHSQHNLLLIGAVAMTARTAEDRTGVVLPLTILNLMILGPVSALQIGGCLVCIDRIDPVGLATWIRDERISTMSAVPTIIHDLLTHPDVAPGDLVSLTRPGCGGGATPDSFRRLYEERFGVRLTTGTGSPRHPPRSPSRIRRCRGCPAGPVVRSLTSRSPSAPTTASCSRPARSVRCASARPSTVSSPVPTRRCSATGTGRTRRPRPSATASCSPATSGTSPPKATS